MAKIRGCFHVAAWDSNILIQVEGYATLNNSIFFKEFVEQMLQKGFRDFIVDLSLCQGMDSTFMGVLVGIKFFFQDTDQSDCYPRVTLINLTNYHQNLLDTLGISAVLEIKKTPIQLPNIPMTTLQETRPDTKVRLKIIREAHQYLVSLNEKNKKIFTEFLRMLDQELQEKSYLSDQIS